MPQPPLAISAALTGRPSAAIVRAPDEAPSAPVPVLTALLAWPLPEVSNESAVTVVMAKPPPGPVVLEEEEFQSSLKGIIDRDFFPELCQREDSEAQARTAGLSLNQFLDNYVSEDNNAYAEIVQREREARPLKPPNNGNLPALLADSPAPLLLKDAELRVSNKETNPAATRFGSMGPPPRRSSTRPKRKESRDFDGYQLVSVSGSKSASTRSIASQNTRLSASGRARKRVLSLHAQALVKRLQQPT